MTGVHTCALPILSGGGTDIWNNEDHFQFAYQALNGDAEITAKVLSFTQPATNSWAKGGVMIRQDLTEAGGLRVVNRDGPLPDYARKRRQYRADEDVHLIYAGTERPRHQKHAYALRLRMPELRGHPESPTGYRRGP